MLAHVTRSGVIESKHDGAVAAVDTNGKLIASSGEVHTRFLTRSAIKPIQAQASLEAGAELPSEWLAVACASHGSDPVQTAIVRAMLESGRLGEEHLRTPPVSPSGAPLERLIRAGELPSRALFNNCSGKHAALLLACVSSGWDVATYLDVHHPVQLAVARLLGDLVGRAELRTAVDGCGAPTFAVSALELAVATARVGNDDRFDRVFEAMHRFPRLTSASGHADAEIAIHCNAVAKRGAEAVLAVTVPELGGLAVKVADGGARAVGPVAVEALRQLGWVGGYAAASLVDSTASPMFGGGFPVGTVEPVFELTRA